MLKTEKSKLTKAERVNLMRLLREKQKRERWRENPIDYLHERLKIKKEHIDWTLIPEYARHKWDGTPNPLMSLCQALAEWKWVAVEGATGVSKTFTAACLALWFLECFENSLVVTTAPKEQQLELHLWKEVQKLQPLFNRGKLGSLKLQMIEGHDEWLMIGFTAGVKASEAQSSATKAQGFHAEHMLMIVEETPGVNEAVLNALEMTSIAPHNLIMALGNPDHQLDTLHRFATRKNVVHITISGFDHPNVVLKNPSYIPGAQTEIGLERLLAKFRSPENPLYLSRARGISPAQSLEALIRLEWIRNAQARDGENKGNYSLGVDVANSIDGDKAAIAYGRGNELVNVDDFPCPNSNKLGEQVFYIMKQKGINEKDVAIDGVGVGAGTVNELERLGARIVNILSGSKPVELSDEQNMKQKEEFNNLRSQMWWQLRLDLQDEKSNLVLPDDDELIVDLLSPKWEIRGGKIIVESKEDIKKRIGRSPNKGDAVVYWNWIRRTRTLVPAMQGMQTLSEKEVQSRKELTRQQILEQHRSNHISILDRY